MRSRTKISIFSIVLILLVSIISITIYCSMDVSDVELSGFKDISEFYPSNRHTYQEDYQTAASKAPKVLGANIKEISTEIGTVEVDTDTLAFKFTNKRGFTWASTVDYAAEDSELNTPNKNKVRSAIILNAYDTTSPSFIKKPLYLSDAKSVQFNQIKNGFSATVQFYEKTKKTLLDITVSIIVTFTEDGINVSIPIDQIKEVGEYLISDICVYPYFGSVKEDKVPGYIFVPDGVGALIRYKKATKDSLSNYEKYIYGKDISYSSASNILSEQAQDSNIYAPVYGFVHGVDQNAIFAVIESGAEYGSINVEYATTGMKYSTIFPRFTYRRVYKQPMDKAGSTIELLQKDKNEFDINIKFLSLENENANYVGMANSYNSYLQEKESLTKKEQSSSISLRVDTIGLERTKGVLFDKKIVMTTFSEYKDILDTLKASGINNITGVVKGFTNYGVSWAAPNYEKFSKKLGSQSDLNSLVENYNIYFETEYQKATSKVGGYNSYFDLAKRINDQRYVYEYGDYEAYLLTHSKTVEVMKESISKLDKSNIKNLYIQSMGNLLYSDNLDGVSLTQAETIYKEALKDVKGDLALSNVYAYLWGAIDEYFDFPLYSSQYLTFDDTVPFLAITLSNSMNLYSSYANFYAYPREELLRLIDYNVYPSFIVTDESSSLLEKTNLNNIYSSKFDDLKTAVTTYYEFVNTPLKHVVGASLVSRTVPANGIVINKYSNNVEIIV